MTLVYENIQDLRSEGKNQRTDKEPPPRSALWNLCSGPYPFLFSLGLSLLLLLVVCIVGYQYAQVQRDLQTLRKNFSNFASDTGADVQELTTQGPNLQDMIQSLKAKVEEHRQELQTDQSAIFLQIQQLVKDLKTLTRDLGDQKSNGSGMICCPVNWTLHKGSCYWFSQSRKSWPEASQFCQLNKAHLVVINSKEEQEFLQDNMSLKNIWLGLTDQNGPWRWVDGTDYQTGFKYWKPKQPDNWHGHGMGGGEDCAHLDLSGFWNDDVCKKSYYWICEAELDKAS